MKKHEWAFQFRADVLGDAAKGLAAYHRERERFYDDAHTDAVNNLKAHGMTTREIPVTGGVRTEMVIDPQRQQLVNEMANKRESHKGSAEQYEVYIRAFQLCKPDQVFDLHADDIRWFGL